MKNQIIAWVQGPRNFYDGVAIYNKYGHNLILKRRFANKNETTEILLFSELCKLAGISETQANKFPRLAKNNTVTIEKPKVEYQDDTLIALMAKLGVTTSDLEAETEPQKIEDAGITAKSAYGVAKRIYTSVPETTKRIIKIREEFPFLKSPDCPIEIKVLVHDMFTEYDKYRDAHLKLTEAPDSAEIGETFAFAQTAVESYLSNRAMWKELEHYKEKNEILGEHPILQEYNQTKELKSLSDIDLNQKLLNVRSYITRAKNKINQAAGNEKKILEGKESLDKWESVLKLIEAELNSRKK